jgi:predicted permease
VLCAIAGAAGLVLTWWAMRALDAWQPVAQLPVAIGFGVNARVLAVAAATVLGTALLAGLAPALQSTAMNLAAAMKEGGLQSGTRRTRLRSAFVVAQVALSVVLLTVAGLFVRSLQRTLAMDPGFDAANVAHVSVDLGTHGYDRERARDLYARLGDALRAHPSIAAASFANFAPLTGNVQTWHARRTDRPADEPTMTNWSLADAGFVELLRTRLLAGRTFTRDDGPNAQRAVVINEALARRLWPGERPTRAVGREIEILDERATVVGVLATGRYGTLHEEEERPFAYLAFAQHPRSFAQLYVRARGGMVAALRAVREELATLDPNVAVETPTLLTTDIDRYLLPQRVSASLVGMFGVAGLALAMAGLYGVLAFGVAQRLGEFGVRMALGARAADLTRLVVRNGLVLAAVGIAIGVVAAVAAGQMVRTFLFGLSPADPLTLVTVPLLLVAVALLASLIPARRAATADPMTSLRAE